MIVRDRSYELGHFTDYDWEIEQSVLPQGEYLRGSDIAPYYRIRIALTGGEHVRYDLLELDHCEGYVASGVEGLLMQRRRVDEVFDLDILKDWLKNCDAVAPDSYAHWLKPGQYVLHSLAKEQRLRMLDVYSGDIRVVDSGTTYLALSYVWGDVQTQDLVFHTNRETDKQVAWSVDLGALPGTIHDAVTLTRMIGKRFLWVDALCINQNDDLDKSSIVSSMDTIYNQAYLTIEATDGSDANAGIRRMERVDSSQPREEPIRFVSHKKIYSLLPARPGYETATEPTKWKTRGWTYQEHILSARSVTFTSDEVFFSGLGIQEREAFVLKPTNSRPPRSPNMPITRPLTTKVAFAQAEPEHGRILRRYFRAVEEYSLRDLTYPGDRLNAFTGILQFLTARSGQQSQLQALGGLLENTGHNTFMACLHWQPGSYHPMLRIHGDTARRWALPSWSWVGWLGEVWFDQGDEVAGMLEVKRVDANNIVESRTTGDKDGLWRPPLSSLTPRDAFVLHLWAPILVCKLEVEEVGGEASSQSNQRYRRFDMVDPSTGNGILLHSSRKEELGRHDFQADPDLVSTAIMAGGLHEVVCIGRGAEWGQQGTWAGSFMLVKRIDDEPYNGKFYERVAISAYADSYHFAKKDIRLERQHVMLI